MDINPKDETMQTPPHEVLVNTGSELTWLPKSLLLQAGIMPRDKKRFYTATKELIERGFGYAILQAEGYSTINDSAGSPHS